MERSRDQFSKKSASKDGLKSICKACVSAYMKARREANPEADRARCKDYREKHRDAVLAKKREWYWNNREAQRQGHREHYLANRESIIAKTRAYAAENPDKVKTRKKRYYEKNKTDLLVKTTEYAKANPQIRKKAQRNYYEKNAQIISEKSRTYRLANSEKCAEWGRAWRRANPDLVNSYGVRYRATKLNCTMLHNPELLSLVEIEAFDLARRREAATGFKWEIDHIVPLQSPLVCGLHNEHNLAVIPRRLNRRKSNRYWPDMP